MDAAASRWKRRVRTRIDEIERGDLRRTGLKLALLWILWAPSQTRAESDDDRPRKATTQPEPLRSGSPELMARPDRPTYVSAVGGFPQLLGIAVEQPISDMTSAEFHLGTVLLAQSVGARVIYGAQDNMGIYGFAGGGLGILKPLADIYPGEDPPFIPYAWTGVGARVGEWRGVRVFFEVGLAGGVYEHGFTGAPTMAAGISFPG